MPYVPIQVCNFGLVYIVLVSSNATSFNDLNPTLNDSGAPNATQPFKPTEASMHCWIIDLAALGIDFNDSSGVTPQFQCKGMGPISSIL